MGDNSDSITFTVNGIKCTVGSEITSGEMLLDYLRHSLELRGTKYMCREGGCGACIVNVSTKTGEAPKAVNSCLVAVSSCNGWDITTIEGLGNKLEGYHSLQKTVAENHATQCGYCTPGWIMAMNGFMETKKEFTMLEVEKAFGSNLCRCTGYRSILDSFKKYAKDAPKELKITDIENLTICKKKKGNSCCADEYGWCMVGSDEVSETPMKKIVLSDNKIWYLPRTLADVFEILQSESSGTDYMLIAGNTAKGVSPITDYPHILICINHLTELKTIEFDQNLVIGAGNTLTEFMTALKTYSTKEYFTYLSIVYDHMDLVAHIPVRNVGTIAGNLMIKHVTNSFQSDVFLLLETVGAQVTIVDWHGNQTTYTMQEFLKLDMTGKVIHSIMMPPLTDAHKLKTYKIMTRSQSAHAIVNAGFLYKLTSDNVVEEARIVYGALSTNFIRATATESYLVGKSLFTNDVLQAALKVLDGELVVEEMPPEPSAAYRRHLAKALFFKGLLCLCPSTSRGTRLESAITNIHAERGVSSGKQVYTSDSALWPINQCMQKLEAVYQAAGEAVYVDDLPSFPNEVYAAFALSTVAVATIVKIDATEAMKLEGVIAFYTAKDIPGLNSFTPADSPFFGANEEVLADGTVKYYHQPIGIIVAKTQRIAVRAAKLVTAKYTNVTTPVTDINVAKQDSSRNTLYYSATATSTGTDVYKTIKGNTTFGGQYHCSMETMVAVSKPTEEGIEVHSSTQWLDGTHVMISRALGLAQNKIDVYLRRVGGSYGMKISRSIQSAVACSLVTHKLQRPCRFIQPMTTNMRSFGKRMPASNDYEVSVNSSGVIQSIVSTLYEDNGYKINETLTAFTTDCYYNCYDVSKFTFNVYDTITDTPKNTWCRSPGTLEAIGSIEYVMERIAYELSLDPVTVRLANLDTTNYNDLADMVVQLKADADYVSRKAAVDSFNTQNRWKKRGLRFAFVRWPPAAAQRLDINISVFHGDGTIVITHGGVEMGQGLNTKVVQIAAHFLNVPVSIIQVKCNNSNNAPNSFVTGGCTTTESIAIALRRACKQLTDRFEPIKETLTNPTWAELVKAAYTNNVDLQGHGFVSMADANSYNIYGLSLMEVEIDVLTGEYEVCRCDIIQDVGVSFNPDIDIGQVEGGFLMGMGYFTSEYLERNSEGELLTDRAWHYPILECRDIPKIFNVSFKKNSYSNDVILGSKGVGEPSLVVSICVVFALREAITMARQESGIPTTEWFQMDGPCTTEAVCMATKTNCEDFKFS